MGRITGSNQNRKNSLRLSEAERFRITDNETVQRIEKILENLLARLRAEAASVFISCERDVCIAMAGQMNLEYGFNLPDDHPLFSGKTIRSKRQYIKPIETAGVVVGYLAVQINDENETDLDNFCTIYADQLLHELEMAEMRSALMQKMDRLRRKKEELTEVQEYNNNLLSITSHDLSSPLNAISGYLDLIDNCLKDEAQLNQIIDYHKRIQSGVHDVMDILNQMSDVSKLERGSIQPDMIKVNLGWVVEDVCKLLENNALKKQIELEVNLSEYPVYIEADTVLLKRIIRNLLDNAIKYTSDSGRVEVEVYKMAGKACLKIKDNGEGISRSDRSRIFAPFVKLRESKDYTSSGIGLFITSYFVDLMNGGIKIESEKNEGSIFSVFFPTLNPLPVLMK